MRKTSPSMTIMIRAAEKAARSLARDFGEVENLQVSHKGPGDFVSAADHRAEELIYEEISRAYPADSFVMEERGVVENGANGRKWIVDPLDGTANFLHGIPHWSISIALEEQGVLVAGLVFDVTRGEMFMAEKGIGAFVGRHRLRVSARRDHPVVITGAPHAGESMTKADQFLREYAAIIRMKASPRRLGSAALDLCYVAAGRAEGFWERHLKAWDIAAGILIVRESGGFISDVDSDTADPLITGNILAANEKIFSALKATLRRA